MKRQGQPYLWGLPGHSQNTRGHPHGAEGDILRCGGPHLTQDPNSIQDIPVILQWLPHPHEYNILQAAALLPLQASLGEEMLLHDGPRRQILMLPSEPSVAESAGHGTTDLRGYAHSSPLLQLPPPVRPRDYRRLALPNTGDLQEQLEPP
eukprot:CAMPEP_0204480822 /NCGR_PEP_ID=MMETSP0471-20130131/44714_1 /ASSEMBLY_ACC=CAM_ASM_000602 /TAXON_ID=2969 /ORGANISM="Oxyrrhis marina" /LENGTH=149 /DNA_ID=CAMNT_0051483905 /DNA_START=356 /DNA_END=801 /DNA_ORIENTATION=-